MFPRVLGFLAGRAAAFAVDVYHRVTGTHQNQNSTEPVDRFVAAGLASTAFAPLPIPLRIPAVLLSIPYLAEQIHELRENQPDSNPAFSSLECYLRAAEAADPFLVSPVGTLPFEGCR